LAFRALLSARLFGLSRRWLQTLCSCCLSFRRGYSRLYVNVIPVAEQDVLVPSSALCGMGPALPVRRLCLAMDPLVSMIQFCMRRLRGTDGRACAADISCYSRQQPCRDSAFYPLPTAMPARMACSIAACRTRACWRCRYAPFAPRSIPVHYSRAQGLRRGGTRCCGAPFACARRCILHERAAFSCW